MMMATVTIPTFSGADPTYPAARWVEDFTDHAEVFGWSPPQKLLMARRTLTGVAGLWLRSENTFKSFDELQRALLEEFPYQVNPKEIHELMTNRKKRNEESCYEYMLVMKELGKRGGFSDYVAIQYIVDGIEDCVINKVILYGVTTYPELKEKLKIYEYMKSKMAASATKKTSQKSEQPRRQRQKTIEYDSTVATPSGTRNELPMMDVSIKQESEPQQSSGYGCQSEMSAKQHSIVFEVRMDEVSDQSDDYSKENKVTAIETKENEDKKCQTSIRCQKEVVNVVNKPVLENKKVEVGREASIELKSIKEENIVEQKVEEVFSETKIVEEKEEKVVENNDFSGGFACLVKNKDGPTRRFINKKVYNEINGIRQPIDKKVMVAGAMEIERARRVGENRHFTERIMKDAMSKDYHVLR